MTRFSSQPCRALFVPLLAALLPACGTNPWDEPALVPDLVPQTAAGSLVGTVVDGEGAALVGALVTLTPSGRGAVTGADGTWSIERLLPNSYAVVVAAEGFVTVTATAAELAVDATVEVNASLVAAIPTNGALRVTVADPSGAPAVGMVVTATGGAEVETAETDIEGVAVVGNLGGAVVTARVEDPTGRLAPARIGATPVPITGAAHAAVSLSGLPAPGATYVGSDWCFACHRDLAEAHADTPHGAAISEVSGAVEDDFDSGATISLENGAKAKLGYDGGTATVWLTDTAREERTFPIAGVLGGEARGAKPWTEIGPYAFPLPLAWAPADPARLGWPGAAGGWGLSGEDAWFDSNGKFNWAAAETPAPNTSAETMCFACHTTGYVLAEAGDGGLTMTASSGSGRWVEGAVGCERCHGPGSEHVDSEALDKPFTIVNPAKLDRESANEVCAQCHSNLTGGGGSRFAWTPALGSFTPGQSLADFATANFVRWPVGAAAAPAEQADELAASGHATGLWSARCTDCHNPHGDGAAGARAGLVLSSTDNTLCATCHLPLSFAGDDAQLEQHSGHPVYDPDASGGEGRCTGCHMPGTATGMWWNDESGGGDLASHRLLAIPPAETLVDFDALGETTLDAGQFTQNACAECHAFNAWRLGDDFSGPSGDSTERSTHSLYSVWYGMWF